MATVIVTEHTKNGPKTYEVDVTDAPTGFFKHFISMSDFHDGPPGNNHWTVSTFSGSSDGAQVTRQLRGFAYCSPF